MKWKLLLTQLLYGGEIQTVAESLRKENDRKKAEKNKKNFIKDGYLKYEENDISVRHDLSDGITHIGCANNAECNLLSPQISLYHAELIRDNGRYFIKDVSPDGSTFLNGTKLVKNKPEEIQPGAVICLNDSVKMTFGRRSHTLAPAAVPQHRR